jgi:hypothetical protein
MLCVRQIILNHRYIVVTRFIAAKQPLHQVKPIDLDLIPTNNKYR